MVMEMNNYRVAFDNYEENNSDLVAYEEITVHFIFDVNCPRNLEERQGLLLMGI